MKAKIEQLPKETINKLQLNFWKKISKQEETKCWNWTGSTFKKSGYGKIGINYKYYLAHRISYLLTYNKWPMPLCLHKCDNRLCVNPEHLYEGDNFTNSRDMVEKGRSAKGDKNASRKYPERRPRGKNHWSVKKPEALAKGEAHGNAKLTEQDIYYIRNNTENLTQLELANKFNVNITAIKKIIYRKTWKHIK